MGNDAKSSGKGEPPASRVIDGEVYMRQALIGQTIANLDQQRVALEKKEKDAAEAQRRYEQMAATLRSSDETIAQQNAELRRANQDLETKNSGLEARIAQMAQAPSPHSPTALEMTDPGTRLSSPMVDVASITEQYETKLREIATGYDRRIEELMQSIARYEASAKEDAVKYRKLEGECRAATEELGKAEETITNLMTDLRRRNDARLDSGIAFEDGENTLIGITAPVAPEEVEQKAAGIYATLVKIILENSNFSDNKKRSSYYTRLIAEGVSSGTASKIVIDVLTDSNIYKQLLEEGKKLDTILASIFRARRTLDERTAQIAPLLQRADQLPAEEARLRKLGEELEARGREITARENGLADKVRETEASLAEKVRQKEAEFAERDASINKRAIDAAALHTREMKEMVRRTADELKHKEQDLQEREIAMGKEAAAIRDGMQSLKELATRFRTYYRRQADFSIRLRDLMQNNFKAYQARAENIRVEKRVGGVAIIFNEAYIKKMPLKEGADVQDAIYSGSDAEAITKLRKLIVNVPKADQPSMRQDESAGHYMIHPIITENNIPIAYFCMTGIPDEAKKDPKKLDELIKIAAAVKHAILTEYTTMHLLSEEGELGYINGRLASLEKAVGLDQRTD